MKISKINNENITYLKELFELSWGKEIDIQDEINYFNEEQPKDWYVALDENNMTLGFIRDFPTMDSNILKVEIYSRNNNFKIEELLINVFAQDFSKNNVTIRFSLDSDKLYLKEYLEDLGFINDKNFLKFLYNKEIEVNNINNIRYLNNISHEIEQVIDILKHFQTFTAEKIVQYIDKKSIIVYEKDSEIIGVSFNQVSKDNIEIIEIVIKKNLRGKGFGKIFLEGMIAFYRSINNNINFDLKVESKNISAISLYKSVGFEEIISEKETWLSKTIM
ncbi:MAG: GNAT family N-acetyltransferase [Candidatus Sericytochromatia bacterium]